MSLNGKSVDHIDFTGYGEGEWRNLSFTGHLDPAAVAEGVNEIAFAAEGKDGTEFLFGLQGISIVEKLSMPAPCAASSALPTSDHGLGMPTIWLVSATSDVGSTTAEVPAGADVASLPPEAGWLCEPQLARASARANAAAAITITLIFMFSPFPLRNLNIFLFTATSFVSEMQKFPHRNTILLYERIP